MNNKSFTLIEMVVAVGIFSLVTASATGLFVSALKAQKQALETQELLDQTSYVMEYMSRSLRMAKKDLTGICTGTTKLNYEFADQCIKFKNYRDECQQFCLDGKRLKDEDGNYLTSEKLEIESFNVSLIGAEQTDDVQAKITLFLDVRSKGQSRIKIQTTVSQRNPDIRQ